MIYYQVLECSVLIIMSKSVFISKNDHIIFNFSSQSRPIDFVLPSIPPALAALASPSAAAAETVSLSSSESSDMPLWARLAMLEPGKTNLFK